MKFPLLLVGFVVAVNVAEGYVCDYGWIFNTGNGHCYRFSHDYKTWKQAEKSCLKIGGYLVKVNNRLENNWLRYNAKRINNMFRRQRVYWLGATDSHREGHWKWIFDSSPVRFKGWSPRQPNNRRGNEDCAILTKHHNYGWESRACNTRENYICEGLSYGCHRG